MQLNVFQYNERFYLLYRDTYVFVETGRFYCCLQDISGGQYQGNPTYKTLVQ